MHFPGDLTGVDLGFFGGPMGMVRLGPIALALIVAILPLVGLAPEKVEAAAKKFNGANSKASQVGGRPDSSQAPSSQVGSKSLTVEKKSDSSIPSSLDNKTHPSYRHDNPDLRLSLGQAVQIALARNLTMADSRLAVDEKEYQRREAYSDFFPSIALNYSGTWDRYQNIAFETALSGAQNSKYGGFQQQTRLDLIYAKALVANQPPPFWGPQSIPGSSIIGNPEGSYPYRVDPYRQFSGSVTITQPIFSGGKLINDYKYTRLGVDYSAIQYEVNKQDLVLNVYQAYYQMMQAQKLLDVAISSIQALEALRNQTMEFYKFGTVAKVDVLSTEGQLAQAMIQRTQALADIAKNQATLNYLLRNPQNTPIQIIEDMSFTPSEYRLPDSFAIAAANRLEIRQAEISVDQALALVKSANASLMPNIDLAVQGTRYNDDWNIIDPEGTNDWRLQALLTWTFDMFRSRSTVAERRTAEARAFVNRELLVETVMNEVKQAYEDMKRSESDIGNNKAAVDYRTENFRINRERYKEQVATYVEVLDAQRQLSLSQGDYYISLMGYRINKATLERKMGILK